MVETGSCLVDPFWFWSNTEQLALDLALGTDGPVLVVCWVSLSLPLGLIQVLVAVASGQEICFRWVRDGGRQEKGEWRLWRGWGWGGCPRKTLRKGSL